MSIEDIIADTNYVQESALLPLTKIKTQKDIDKYSQQGYMVGYTVDSWKNEYSYIPVKYVYYLPGINTGTYYYNKEHFIFLNLNIYGTRVMFADAVRSRKLLLAAIQRQEDCFANGDYFELFMTMPDGIRMDAMERLLEIEGPTEKFYDVFTELYTMSNFRASSLSSDLASKLKSCKTANQQHRTECMLQEHFGDVDPIPVYRGMSNGSTSPDKALSWTTNIDVANFFACRLGYNGKILKGCVAKKDIIECFLDDSESEVIVAPGSVNVLSETSLIYPDSYEVMSCLDSLISVYQPWRERLRKLYKSSENDQHDALHSLRVLFYACFIALQLELDDDTVAEICEAAIYHDIGRIDDDVDIEHGRRSAKIYAQDGGDDPIVDFAIKMHCIDDDKAKVELEKCFDDDFRDYAWTALCVLKDADALDRVRFGIGYTDAVHADGVRISMLRYDISKRMTPLAMSCLKQLAL